jgi:hypothetical protein
VEFGCDHLSRNASRQLLQRRETLRLVYEHSYISSN